MKQYLKENKKILVIIIIVVILIVAGGLVFAAINSNHKKNGGTVLEQNGQLQNSEQGLVTEVMIGEGDNTIINTISGAGKVDIIDINSNTRPYAVVVNNTPVAVKVQEGLNKAYLVYEIPTEGNTSRLMALYKDIEEDLVIGTIRSARHNFIDYALESDAIFCCFGWSHYAEDDLKAGRIDYLQGLYGEPFYRNNPENLVTEHTAYTSMSKLKNAVANKNIRSTSDNSILLNYNVTDVELSVAEDAKNANSVTIPYGYAPNVTSFKYDEGTRMYTRYENGVKCIDHNTKEDVTTKNIIVQKLGYTMCDDNYYWDLYTVGSGTGYYITNGYYIPINWNKSSRESKTKYTYKPGTVIDGKDVGGQEISVSDGRTWIEIQTTKQTLTIE